MFWRISRQNPSTALGCSELQEPKKTNMFLVCKVTHAQKRNAWADRDELLHRCTGIGVHDVITCADLYYDRLRGLSVAGGQILAFSIDLLRRPYNSYTLCDNTRNKAGLRLTAIQTTFDKKTLTHKGSIVQECSKFHEFTTV